MSSILEKIGAFFEAHVEKLVLLVVLLICGWILLTRVVFSPNRIPYDNRTFSPTAIDQYLAETYAGDVEARLEAQPQKVNTAEKLRFDHFIDDDDPVRQGIRGNLEHGFTSIFDNSILAVNVDLPLPLPGSQQIESHRVVDGEPRDYHLPLVGDIWDVEVERIRAAAYVPTVPLREDVVYSQSNSEPNDIDLVTVQATFNAATLYRRFHDSFAGREVPEKWRDEEMAKPVFGAVKLERQEQLPNGTWSDWRVVPRIGIEHQRRLFAPIEEVNELPAGGVPVRLLQLKDPFNQAQLLQPPGYSMASAYEEWYPPALHREYVVAYDKIKKQERRDEREQDQSQRDAGRRRPATGTGAATGDTTNTRSRNTRGGETGAYDTGDRGTRGAVRGRSRPGAGGDAAAGAYGDYGLADGGRGGVRPGRPGRPGGDAMGYGADMYGMGLDSQSPTIEVVRKYNALRITPRTDLAETSDLLFWAHDDTVVPGKTYRYRLRLGVLNPVAGTNYLADEFQVFRNKVLLWSEPSEVSAPVLIPARTYFFASSFRENTQTMYVTVAKYLLGYWWAETFDVNPGETIGRVVENRKEMGQDNAMMTQGMDPYSMGMVAQEVTTEPKEIDYRTDAVFLGVSKTDAWSGGNRLHEQILYRMLYTLDGSEITYAPVSSTSWDDSLRSAYADIMRQKNREKEDFKAFSTPTSDMGMDPYGYGGEMGGFGG